MPFREGLQELLTKSLSTDWTERGRRRRRMKESIGLRGGWRRGGEQG